MCLIPGGISVGIILVAGDGVVPVDNVDRSVRPNPTVDWAEVSVLGAKQRFFPVEFEARPLLGDGESFDAIRLKVANDKVSIEIFGKVTPIEHRDTAVPARIANTS